MTFPMDQYRRVFADLARDDRVAQVDDRVDALWQQAHQRYGPGLDDQQYAAVPLIVSPDLTAPPDLDIDTQLDRIERQVRDLSSPSTGALPSARWTLAGWLIACLVFAIVLGGTVTGLTVIPAFVPAMVTGGLLLLTGPGRVPGWIWAVGLASLSLALISGKPPSDHSSIAVPPPWFLGVVFVVLAVWFARGIQLAGRRRLAQRQDATRAQELAVERRPLELVLTLLLFGSMTAGAQIAVLMIVTTVAGLLRRRRWTSALAALTALLTLFIASRDASNGYDTDWAHPIVIAALTAFWLVAVFHEPWRHRLSRTERVLSLAGRTAAAGYRAAEANMSAGLANLASRPRTPPSQPARPEKPSKYPEGQFGRYCANCAATTAHVSRGGFASPQCVPCGSRDAGGTSGDRNHPDYCSTCNSTTPHTAKGCVVCTGSR